MQKADRDEADKILKDPKLYSAKFQQNKFEFLMIVSDPIQAFTIRYQGQPVLFHLLSKGLFHVAEYLFERTGLKGNLVDYLDSQLKDPFLSGIDCKKHKELLVEILYEAVQANKLDIVKTIIKYRPDLVNEVRNNRSLLIYASYYGYSDIVEILIKNGASVNYHHTETSSDMIKGKSALYWAIKFDHVNVAKQLLDANASDEIVVDKNKSQLIHIAAKNGNLAMMKLLLSKHKNYLDMPNAIGETPFLLAANRGHTKVVAYLLELGANINACVTNPDHERYDKTALELAVENVDPEIFNVLITKDNIKRVPLHELYNFVKSIMEVDKQFHDISNEALEIIIKNRPDCLKAEDSTGYTLLHYAIIYNNESAFNSTINFIELLDEKAKFTYLKSLLSVACQCGNLSFVKALLKLDKKLLDANHESIFSAVTAGHLDVVEFFVENKVDINIKNRDGKTPLDIAIEKRNYPMIKYLFEHDTVTDTKNLTNAISTAIAENVDLNIIKNLIESKKLHDKLLIPFLMASAVGNIAALKLLLEFDPKLIDKKTESNNTGLMNAAHFGQLESVEFLIGNKANPNEQNKDNKSPLQLAMETSSDTENKKRNTVISHLIKLDTITNMSVLLEALNKAIHENNHELIHILLTEKPELLQEKNKNGETVLHELLSSNINLFNQIFSYCSNKLNIVNDSNMTLLHKAIITGNYKVVEAMVKMNPSIINQIDHNGNTALIYAAQHDHIDMDTIKYLLECGAEIFVQNNNNDNVFTYLLKNINTSTNTNLDLIMALIMKNKITNPDIFNECCKFAIEKNNLDLLKNLFKHNNDLIEEIYLDRKKLLNSMIKYRRQEMFDLLISCPSQNKINALNLAVRDNSFNMVFSLLKTDPQLVNQHNSDHIYPLAVAVSNSLFDMTKKLIEAGANPESKNTIGNKQVTALEILILQIKTVDDIDSRMSLLAILFPLSKGIIPPRQILKLAAILCNTHNTSVFSGQNELRETTLNLLLSNFPEIIEMALPNNNTLLSNVIKEENGAEKILMKYYKVKEEHDNETILDIAIKENSKKFIAHFAEVNKAEFNKLVNIKDNYGNTAFIKAFQQRGWLMLELLPTDPALKRYELLKLISLIIRNESHEIYRATVLTIIKSLDKIDESFIHSLMQNRETKPGLITEMVNLILEAHPTAFTLKLLLNEGLDRKIVTAKPNENSRVITPLCVAVAENKLSLIYELIMHGANTNVKFKNNKPEDLNDAQYKFEIQFFSRLANATLHRNSITSSFIHAAEIEKIPVMSAIAKAMINKTPIQITGLSKNNIKAVQEICDNFPTHIKIIYPNLFVAQNITTLSNNALTTHSATAAPPLKKS